MALDLPYIAIYISALSLLVSIFTYWRQRKRLTVDFDDTCFLFDSTKNIYLDDNHFFIPTPFGIQTGFSLINPGHCNISIFSLMAINLRTGKKQCIFLKSLIPDEYKNCQLKLRHSAQDISLPEIPARPSALIQSGEYLRIDLIIFPDEDTTEEDSILVTFKSTNTSFLHRICRSTSSEKRKYRTYEKIYSLSEAERITFIKAPISQTENQGQQEL